MVLTNYAKNTEHFQNWIRVFPLYTNDTITQFLGIMERLVDTPPSYMHTKSYHPVVGIKAKQAPLQQDIERISPKKEDFQRGGSNYNYPRGVLLHSVSSSGIAVGQVKVPHGENNGSMESNASVANSSKASTGKTTVSSMSSISLAYRMSQLEKLQRSGFVLGRDQYPPTSSLPEAALNEAQIYARQRQHQHAQHHQQQLQQQQQQQHALQQLQRQQQQEVQELQQAQMKKVEEQDGNKNAEIDDSFAASDDFLIGLLEGFSKEGTEQDTNSSNSGSQKNLNLADGENGSSVAPSSCQQETNSNVGLDQQGNSFPNELQDMGQCFDGDDAFDPNLLSY